MKWTKLAGFLAAASCVTMIGAGAVMAEESNPISVCIITSSGIDDGSFNQDCYNGILTFIEDHDAPAPAEQASFMRAREPSSR